jgi:hypothetical protein
MMKPLLTVKIAFLGVMMSFLVFTQFAWAGSLDAGLETMGSVQTPRIQEALAELADAGGGKGGACYQTGSLEKCAGCCNDLKDACIALVIPLCHEGDPNRAEFRHCVRGREDRCNSDFSNCAWLCRRTKTPQ